ncbi:MAG: hypothetical protein K0R66_1509 [Gammaproteobacteria bacterium]|jgi:hypothetical protein|nr:hypothetical protein [Gammaproteobacteria bacterium]
MAFAERHYTIDSRYDITSKINTNDPQGMHDLYFTLREDSAPHKHLMLSLGAELLTQLLQKPVHESDGKRIIDPKTKGFLSAPKFVDDSENKTTFPTGKPKSWLEMLVQGLNQGGVKTLHVNLKIDAANAGLFDSFVETISALNNPPAVAWSPPMLSLDLTQCTNLTADQVYTLVNSCRFNVINLPILPSVVLREFYRNLGTQKERDLIALRTAQEHLPKELYNIVMRPSEVSKERYHDKGIVLIALPPRESQDISTLAASLGEYAGGFSKNVITSAPFYTRDHIIAFIEQFKEGKFLLEVNTYAKIAREREEKLKPVAATAGKVTRQKESVAALERAQSQMESARAEFDKLKAAGITALEIYRNEEYRRRVIGPISTDPEELLSNPAKQAFFTHFQLPLLERAAEELFFKWQNHEISDKDMRGDELWRYFRPESQEKFERQIKEVKILTEQWQSGAINAEAASKHQRFIALAPETQEEIATILETDVDALRIAAAQRNLTTPARPIANSGAGSVLRGGSAFAASPSMGGGVAAPAPRGSVSARRGGSVAATPARGELASAAAVPAAGAGAQALTSPARGSLVVSVASSSGAVAVAVRGGSASSSGSLSIQPATGANPRPMATALQQAAATAASLKAAGSAEALSTAPQAASAQRSAASHASARALPKANDPSEPLLEKKILDLSDDDRLCPPCRHPETGGCLPCKEVMAIPMAERKYLGDQPSPSGAGKG